MRFGLGCIVKNRIPGIELHKGFRPEQSGLRGRPEGKLSARKADALSNRPVNFVKISLQTAVLVISRPDC